MFVLPQISDLIRATYFLKVEPHFNSMSTTFHCYIWNYCLKLWAVTQLPLLHKFLCNHASSATLMQLHSKATAHCSHGNLNIIETESWYIQNNVMEYDIKITAQSSTACNHIVKLLKKDSPSAFFHWNIGWLKKAAHWAALHTHSASYRHCISSDQLWWRRESHALCEEGS